MAALNLDTLRLDKGSHSNAQNRADPDCQVCLFEAYNLIVTDTITDDRPADVSPVLHGMGIGLNDSFGDDARQALKQFLPAGADQPSPLAGTFDDGQDEARGWLAVDWLIRSFTPAWLDLAGLTAEATALRDLRRIVDRAAWVAQADVANTRISAAYSAARSAARSAADSAADSAARSAARSAADSAAYSAAYSAADSAARSAAYSAADSAARSAAYSAAISAAQEVLKPTVEVLQQSAVELYRAMINPAAVLSSSTA